MKLVFRSVAFVVILASNRAEADELVTVPARDVPIFAGSFAIAVGLRAAQPALVKSCGWCDRDESGKDTLNGVDRGVRDALRWDQSFWAAQTSNGLAFLGAPISAFAWTEGLAARAHHPTRYRTDLLAVGEAVIVGLALNQSAKVLFRRERPYAHFRTDTDNHRLYDSEEDVSFFSGHTSFTFTLAVAAGTVATIRHYPGAPLVWATGLPIAAATGYLRIAADRHYFTDVLVGALVGTGCGVAVPLLFRHSAKETGTTSADQQPLTSVGGQLVSWAGVF